MLLQNVVAKFDPMENCRSTPETKAGRGLQGRKSEGTPRTSTIERVADPGRMDLERVWDEEWEHYIFEAAIERVKKQVSPEQFQIFALRVFKEWPVMKIARELEVSVGQVYLAKHRISALIRKQVKELEKKMT
jgi:DNA-directed RNA polymerase specialized sigma24 family protein